MNRLVSVTAASCPPDARHPYRRDTLMRLLPLCAALLWLNGCASSSPQPIEESNLSWIPSGFNATQDRLREIVIRWSLPGQQVRLYHIQRASTVQGPFISVVTVNPQRGEYIDKGTPDVPLMDNREYFYRITTELAGGGEALYSQVVAGKTAPPPEPPPSLEGNPVSSRAIRLTWPDSPVPGVMLFTIERATATKPDDYQTIARNLSARQYLDGGTPDAELRDSTEYLYRIVAINAVGGRSLPRLSSKIRTLPPPAPPTVLQATSHEIRCVPLSWEPSQEPDVVRYDIYRRDSDQGAWTKIGGVAGRTTTTFLDGSRNPGDLADAGTYAYRIHAVNNVTAQSASSKEATATTREVPPVVAGVKATPGKARRVPLAWDPSSDERVMGYEIWRGVGDDFTQIAVLGGRTTTRYVDRGDDAAPAGHGLLKDNTEYAYKLVAFNLGYIRSSASPTVMAKTKPRPAAPDKLAATRDRPCAAAISWTANQEPDIVEYEIQASDTPKGFTTLAFVPASKNGPLAARDSGLTDGAVRYYRVKAIDVEDLHSDWSAIAAGQARPIPSPPKDLALKPIEGGVTLSWSAPSSPDVCRYAIWRKTLMAWELIETAETAEYVFLAPALTKGITVAVSAVDKEDRESEKSATVEIPAVRD